MGMALPPTLSLSLSLPLSLSLSLSHISVCVGVTALANGSATQISVLGRVRTLLSDVWGSSSSSSLSSVLLL